MRRTQTKTLVVQSLLTMVLLAACGAHGRLGGRAKMTPVPTTPDAAAITTIIESVATLADRSNFEALEKLYADPVRVDYTSLSGGKAERKSPRALMTSWASVLPGFERTRHDISKVVVNVDGRRATATAAVTASHWVSGLFWEVKGSYRFQLAKQSGMWRITSHTFLLKSEGGTRKVFGPASKRAAAKPVAYLQRQQTRAAVRRFLESLENKDMKAFASVWAKNAVQDMPFSPKGFPKRVEGKEAIVKHYAAWPKNSGKADFTSKLVFYPMRDPRLVFAEFQGNVDIIPTKRRYKQTYGGLFRVVGGKIELFREYYDPAPFKYAFGLDAGGSFHGK